jgi:pathogen-inducible salicylic acid glucosyltransferase
MTGSSDHSIHVLLLSYPAQGHINPLLQFGKRLAAHRAGVRCTLAVTRSALGSTSMPPQAGAVHVATFSDGCDRLGYAEVGDVGAYLARLESAGSRTLDELLRSEAGQCRPVRAVVYDAFLLWAPRVARGHGAACAAFYTQACAVNVAYAHAWGGTVTLPVQGRWPEGLPGLHKGVQLEPADLSTFLTEPAAGSSAYRDLVLQQAQGLEQADHVLINSFYELQAEVLSLLNNITLPCS